MPPDDVTPEMGGIVEGPVPEDHRDHANRTAVLGPRLSGKTRLLRYVEDVLPSLLGQSTDGRAAPIFWRRPPDRPGRPRYSLCRSGRKRHLQNHRWRRYMGTFS